MDAQSCQDPPPFNRKGECRRAFARTSTGYRVPAFGAMRRGAAICVSYSCITQCFFCLVEKAQSDWAASQRCSTLACAPWQSLAWVTSSFARASSRYMECRGSAKAAGVCDTIGCIPTMPSPCSWKASVMKKQEHLKLQKDGCGLEPGVSTRVPTEDQLRH